MASTAAPLAVEINATRTALCKIPEIESAFLLQRQNTFFITLIVATKDYRVEDRIHDAQLQLMDQFTNCLFDFDIVPRNGRKATDVVTPSGQLIFHRAA